MGAGRRAWVASLAVAAAMVPGALRLLPSDAPVARAPVVELGAMGVAGGPSAAPVPFAGEADEVAIIPPGELVGEVARALPAPPPFADVRSTGTGGEVFALVIGIDDYPGTQADLRSAVADAELVDAALAGFGVPAEHRMVLRDGQARRDEVAAAVAALVQQGGPDATLVLAYAGHTRKVAPGREAIVLADGETLTDRELAALLAPATQRMWLLFATCFAGGFTELLAPGRILTGAADADSLAYESPALNASYLVHHLVREGWLEGGAGPTVQDAFRYADARLEAEHPQRRPIQVDEDGRPLRLGPGDPSHGWEPAPAAPSPAPGGPSSPSPSAGPSPPATAPPRPEQSCLLGVLCSG